MSGKTVSLVLVLACVPAMAGERVVQTVAWSEWEASGQLQLGEIRTDTEGPVSEFLHLENAQVGPTTIPILIVDSPNIKTLNYVIRGQIRHSGVQGVAYLEMWNHFADGSQYFTRTLGEMGPMKKIEGDSDWRAITLPFQSSAEVGLPSKLVVNVVMSGPGVVDLGPLQVSEVTNPFAIAEGAWWGLPVAIILGAGGGTALGLIGALVGTLASLGVGRRLATWLAFGTAALGVIFVGAGLAALVASQPIYVTFPTLLLGVLAAGIMGPLSLTLRRRFAATELRKMSAMDAGSA